MFGWVEDREPDLNVGQVPKQDGRKKKPREGRKRLNTQKLDPKTIGRVKRKKESTEKGSSRYRDTARNRTTTRGR